MPRWLYRRRSTSVIPAGYIDEDNCCGEQRVFLRHDTQSAKPVTSRPERAARLREAFANAAEDPLWQALKAKRTEPARYSAQFLQVLKDAAYAYD